MFDNSTPNKYENLSEGKRIDFLNKINAVYFKIKTTLYQCVWSNAFIT